MSLLSTYGSANKVTSVGLDVRYSCEYDSGYYVYTRYATKTYAFVGMDEQTAKTCAAEMRAKYLRKHNRVDIESLTGEGPDGSPVSSTTAADKSVYEALSTISLTHDEGDAWSVEIQVNETDIRATKSDSSSPASLFSTENAWDYDDDGDAASSIVISAVSGTVGETKIETTLTASIQGFNAWSATLVVSSGTSSDIYTCKSASSENGSYTVTWGGTLALTGEDTSVKVNYGAATSNTATFTPSAA